MHTYQLSISSKNIYLENSDTYNWPFSIRLIFIFILNISIFAQKDNLKIMCLAEFKFFIPQLLCHIWKNGVWSNIKLLNLLMQII